MCDEMQLAFLLKSAISLPKKKMMFIHKFEENIYCYSLYPQFSISRHLHFATRIVETSRADPLLLFFVESECFDLAFTNVHKQDFFTHSKNIKPKLSITYSIFIFCHSLAFNERQPNRNYKKERRNRHHEPNADFAYTARGERCDWRCRQP